MLQFHGGFEMKKLDSWNSEFRKNKFYERQKQKHYHPFSLREHKTIKNGEKTIAVMLDLDGTCDYIDDEKADIFVKQLNFIRKKFRANYGTISISTHYNNSDKIKTILDIITKHLTPNIKIGLNFYYGGIYDYKINKNIPKERRFNLDKERTFGQYYLYDPSINNQWFAIIDDGIEDDTYKKYEKSQPMLLCLPSQSENMITQNNFMRIATMTVGFDGVIECLDNYINSIKKLSSKQIFENQKNMMRHLSSYELIQKIRMEEYAFIEQYFLEGYADLNDYQDALMYIYYKLYSKDSATTSFTKDHFIHIKNILEILCQHFMEQSNEQYLKCEKCLKYIESDVFNITNY